ncbi:unnamed protein product [Polarella glacialis]|uniref:Inositol polyphosphate-related phosphatase domain-containing protein n=1 Tax=Polarella glacialis TaxID=89957 RepID=A0A813KKV4_POLGL|nr:unnamed protein product [Polarella glacialis]
MGSEKLLSLSPSGRIFVSALPAFEDALEQVGASALFAKARAGELLELLAVHDAWGFGAPLVYDANGIPLPGARASAGAFRLEWVTAVQLRAPLFGAGGLGHEPKVLDLRPTCAHGVAARFHEIRRRQWLERAAHQWDLTLGKVEAYMGSATDSAAKHQVSQLREKLEAAALAPSAANTLPASCRTAGSDAVPESHAQGTSELESGSGKPLAQLVLEGLAASRQAAPAPDMLLPPPGLEGFAAVLARLPSTQREAGANRPRSGLFPQTQGQTQSDRRLKSRSEREPQTRRHFARSLLTASRTGELQALLEDMRRDQLDMVRSASDLQALKNKFRVAVLGAHRTGELHSVAGDLAREVELAGELAREVERRADDFKRLKERALTSLLRMKRAGQLESLAQELEAVPSVAAANLGASEDAKLEAAGAAISGEITQPQRPARQRALKGLLDMKRSGELQLLAEDMDAAQQQFEAKAAQLRDVATRMAERMRDAQRSDELRLLADEMTQVLDTQVETIRSRVRQGLLRAHRAGELQDLREELDELADEVPSTLEPSPHTRNREAGKLLRFQRGGKARGPEATGGLGHDASGTRKRWSEMTSSDSDREARSPSVVGIGLKHSPQTSADGESVSEDDGQEGYSSDVSLEPSVQGSAPAAGTGSQNSSPGDRRLKSRSEREPQTRRHFARSLLTASRTGELQALLEDMRRDQLDMVRSASDLQALKNKFRVAVLGAHRTGELHSVAGDLAREVELAGELAREVERRADDFKRLKERALTSLLRMKRAGQLESLAQELEAVPSVAAANLGASEDAKLEAAGAAISGEITQPQRPARQRALKGLLDMKRSGELQLLAEDMDAAQQQFEAKAAQLRDVATRMAERMRDAQRSDELRLLADEMTQVLDTQVETIRSRVRQGLLRAHRAGELQDLREELDELADEVPSTLEPSPHTRNREAGKLLRFQRGGKARGPEATGGLGHDASGTRKRWSEMTSSDSDREARAGICLGSPTSATEEDSDGGSANCSDSDVLHVRSLEADSDRPAARSALSAGRLHALQRRWADATTSSDSDVPDSGREPLGVSGDASGLLAQKDGDRPGTGPVGQLGALQPGRESESSADSVGRIAGVSAAEPSCVRSLSVAFGREDEQSHGAESPETSTEGVGFNLGNTSILFVNAHLAAHANKMKERTQSFGRILEDSPIRKEKKGGPGVHQEYDRVFFMGDLNPRLNAKRADVDEWIAQRQYEKCLACDQLLPLLRADVGDVAAGLWPHFEEAAITFPPTYKFDHHSDNYDSSKKKRVPSWTDRILWKRTGDDCIRSLSYGSVQSCQVSDHKPIFAQFEVSVNLDKWEGPAEAALQRRTSSVCAMQ